MVKNGESVADQADGARHCLVELPMRFALMKFQSAATLTRDV